MTPTRLPSLDIPESEKRSYTEADVHSKLFEPDMAALGFPPRTSNQAAGEWFQEQRTLALRRLKSKQSRGQHDGLYLIGNSPVVLCELKRYDALDSSGDFEKAKRQLIAYALSEDFQPPPPFLVLYCGKPERTMFWMLKSLAEDTLNDEQAYEELGPEVWNWDRMPRSTSKASSPRRRSNPSGCSRSSCITSTRSKTTCARTSPRLSRS